MQPGLVRVQSQSKRIGPLVHSRQRLAQPSAIVVEDHEIVAVPHELALAEVRGQELVDWPRSARSASQLGARADARSG